MFRDIVDRNLRDVDDVRQALTACIREIVRTITRAPERATLVRLVISEAPHFPAILDLWHNRGIVPIIAEPLAKLSASGRLDADDPALAAEHLSALTFGQVNNKSMMGTVQLTDSEADRIITSGIAVFIAPTAPPAASPYHANSDKSRISQQPGFDECGSLTDLSGGEFTFIELRSGRGVRH